MKIILLLYLISPRLVLCENILFLDNVLIPSHQMFDYTIAEELLSRGHNVTLLGPKATRTIEHENFTWLQLEDLDKTIGEMMNNPLNTQTIQANSFFQNVDLLYQYSTYMCEDTLRSPNLKKLMNYPEEFKFDVLIFDVTLNGCLYPLIERFHYPPTVGVIPLLLAPYASEIFGNTVNPSYIPHFFLKFSNRMSFLERVSNYFLSTYDIFMRTIVYRPVWNAQLKGYFGENMDDFDELEGHISILLANHMVGFHYARPLASNIIPVGGAHIKPTKALPRSFQTIMDNSKHGVILFSLGTIVNPDELHPSTLQIIVRTLGRLNETVIFKMNHELKNAPRNVIIHKWVPQSDILAHPRTKAFISHCGGHGSMEAAHHGVPVIGLPFFVDQHHSCAQIEAQEMGRVVDVNSMTEDSLFNTIQEVLNNPIYAKTAREISAVVRDQPMPPLERAMFWIEWTIRHNNTKFIQPESRYMSMFSRSCFDIYSFFLSVFVVLLLILKLIFSSIFALIIHSPGSQEKIKSN